MADYILELGLDGDVAPTSDGTYPLMQSVARKDKDTGKWVPAWYTSFEPKDRVAFRFADYTKESADVPFVPVSVMISFRKPDDPVELRTPFVEKINPITTLSSGFDLRSAKGSIVLPGALGSKATYWYLFDPERNGEAHFQIKKAKTLLRFLLRLELTVVYGKQLRTYGHDPEIFVGEGGAPAPEPPLKRRK